MFNALRLVHMVYPFDDLEMLGWKAVDGQPGTVTRPLAGAELVLDQVRRLNDGLNDLSSGVLIDHGLPLAELLDRISESWLRLRFHSPLIGAKVYHDPDPETLGSWVYTAVTLEQAKAWLQQSLHFHFYPNGQLTSEAVEEFVSAQIKTALPFDGKGDVLVYGHILVERSSGRMAIVIHGTHVIFDGPALLDFLYLFLEHIASPHSSTPSTELDWGKEMSNLPPHPVHLVGGAQDGWEAEGIAMLKEMDLILSDERGSHTLRPSRLQVAAVGTVQKVYHSFDHEETSKILSSIKTLQSTVTVALEAAHVLATLNLHAPTHYQGRTVLFPSIVALRHKFCVPWNKRSTVVGTGSAVPITVTHNLLQHGTEREKLLNAMIDIKKQYTKWLSNPHHPLIVPAQQAMNPIRQKTTKPDAEITSLGVLDRKLPIVWKGEDGKDVLVIKDFSLSLRRTTPVLMTHSWTLNGSLRIQCQGSDVWDIEQMQRFLDEIVRLVRVLTFTSVS